MNFVHINKIILLSHFPSIAQNRKFELTVSRLNICPVILPIKSV